MRNSKFKDPKLLDIKIFAVVSISTFAILGQYFPVFDGIKYNKKPPAHDLGLVPIRILDGHHLWEKGQSRDQPNEQKIREAVRTVAPGVLVCLDIENWHVTGTKDVVDESIRKLKFSIQTARDERPDLKFGFYGLLPKRNYWDAIRGPSDPGHQDWVEVNKRTEELAHHVDVVFPSLYTFYRNEKGWVDYAKANLREAHRYNKPVYPFVWPMFHESNEEVGGQWIPNEYWRKQLDICRENSDGIVVWLWYKAGFDEDWPWWLVTEQFLSEIFQPRD